MNGYALVVGNANYLNEKDRLNNAVNDANDFANKLMSLGFTVNVITDCSYREFGTAVEEFGEELNKKYDVALFYYSGHGLQLKGLNYLTATDTSFADVSSAKYTSICLDHIIEEINDADPIVKIIILDACRDNPLPTDYRGLSQAGLASVHAPKGTIIAFSTSPGEKAMDYGAGRNSIYTGALLKHIDDLNTPIEDFFKRVRTSVNTLSNGKQTSWEHTSLIGNFSFNSGQNTNSVNLPYRSEFLSDKDFVSDGSDIHNIIEDLKIHNWYKQNEGIQALEKIDRSKVNSDDRFLLGRNLLQTALGGEFGAQSIMRNLSIWLKQWFIENKNHVLNGMLYEIYFDSNNKLRTNNFKSGYIEEILCLQESKAYESSFDFIRNALTPFEKDVFYMPSFPPRTIPVELLITKIDSDEEGKNDHLYKLLSVKLRNKEILAPGRLRALNDVVSIGELTEKLSKKMAVPQKYLTISCNYTDDQVKSGKIQIPWLMEIKSNIEKQ